MILTGLAQLLNCKAAQEDTIWMMDLFVVAVVVVVVVAVNWMSCNGISGRTWMISLLWRIAQSCTTQQVGLLDCVAGGCCVVATVSTLAAAAAGSVAPLWSSSNKRINIQ